MCKVTCYSIVIHNHSKLRYDDKSFSLEFMFAKVKIDWTFFFLFFSAGGNFVEGTDDNESGSTTNSHNGGHQPSPQILSHDQIFRAQVGETLVLPCQVANLGKDFERKIIFYKQIGRSQLSGKIIWT